MCQSKADGGKRCYTHTSKDVEKARAALGAAQESGDPEAHEAARERYETNCRSFADLPAGAAELAGRLRDIQDGADAAGDDRAVLEDLVGERVRRDREREAEGARLREAMASRDPLHEFTSSTGTPSAWLVPGPTVPTREPLAPRAGAQGLLGMLARVSARLRPAPRARRAPVSIARPAVAATGVDLDRPVQRGGSWFAGGQEDRLNPWRVPVHVQVRPDLPHQSGDGVSMVMPPNPDGADHAERTGALISCEGAATPPEGWRGAVVTVTNHRTGEAMSMRAFARDTEGGTRAEPVWVLHEVLAKFNRGDAWVTVAKTH